ncbi:MAG: DUF1684 domain-containing protein [Acidimicrobiia bacterium]
MSYTEDLAKARNERDLFFKEHYASPMPDEDQAVFTGLDYFAMEPAWRVSVTVQRSDPHKIDVPSTSGMDSAYTTVGSVEVTIGDSAYELVMLDDGDGGIFVPFRDGTCGSESYAGGRYVAVTTDDDGLSFLDFNTAYNPWCVYDEEFVCPLPPPSNWITESIPAGERMYVAPSATT